MKGSSGKRGLLVNTPQSDVLCAISGPVLTFTTVDQSSLIASLWQTEIAPQLRLSSEAEVTTADSGITSEVAIVSLPEGRFVVGWYSSEDPSRVGSYLEAQEVLSDLGFRIPEPVAKGSCEKGTWLLEKHVNGRSFRELLDNSDHVRKASDAQRIFPRGWRQLRP